MPSAKTRPNVSIVAALAGSRRAIGRGGELLVRISDDLRRFRTLTTSHPIIMGRKTYESIGRPLPDRSNFVVTRNPTFSPAGVMVCPSLERAVEEAWALESTTGRNDPEVFLIGGGEIYAQGIAMADRLYLTLIDAELDGDAHFPEYGDFTEVISREDRIDPATGMRYAWLDLGRPVR